jgi:hypothetical protein
MSFSSVEDGNHRQRAVSLRFDGGRDWRASEPFGLKSGRDWRASEPFGLKSGADWRFSAPPRGTLLWAARSAERMRPNGSLRRD